MYPIKAMGISKGMMEKVVVSKSGNLEHAATTICCTHNGNVMASRGLVIPLFIRQVVNNDRISITDPTMTRFMMNLDSAVDLVLHAFMDG
jgi:UDP-N-acetylglucosamine 4,6-dehydratase/5-epimerase